MKDTRVSIHIYYGPPATGKSDKVEDLRDITMEAFENIDELEGFRDSFAAKLATRGLSFVM